MKCSAKYYFVQNCETVLFLLRVVQFSATLCVQAVPDQGVHSVPCVLCVLGLDEGTVGCVEGSARLYVNCLP